MLHISNIPQHHTITPTVDASKKTDDSSGNTPKMLSKNAYEEDEQSKKGAVSFQKDLVTISEEALQKAALGANTQTTSGGGGAIASTNDISYPDLVQELRNQIKNVSLKIKDAEERLSYAQEQKKNVVNPKKEEEEEAASYFFQEPSMEKIYEEKTQPEALKEEKEKSKGPLSEKTDIKEEPQGSEKSPEIKSIENELLTLNQQLLLLNQKLAEASKNALTSVSQGIQAGISGESSGMSGQGQRLRINK